MSLEELKTALEKEHSKKHTNWLVDLILKEELQLKITFLLILQNEELYAQRAAWIIGTLADINLEKLVPFQKELVELTNDKYHDAVLRNSFRTLAMMTIQEKHQGQLFENGLNTLNKESTATAIKTWIIEVLMNISAPYLELQNELKIVLESQIKTASVGIKGKMNKVIQKINNNFSAVSNL